MDYSLYNRCPIVCAVPVGSEVRQPAFPHEYFVLSDSNAIFASELHVNGTHLENGSGENIVLNGIMVPELSKIRSEKKLNKQYFDEEFAFGGNVIRVPVHPYAWEQDEYYLWRYLDPVVEWAASITATI